MGKGRGMAGRLERGDIRFFRFPAPDKQRPVLVLTRQSVIDLLGRITVAPITSTIRGVPSEVMLGPDDGMKQPCAVNLHNVVTVAKMGLGRRVAHLDGPSHGRDLRRARLRPGMRGMTALSALRPPRPRRVLRPRHQQPRRPHHHRDGRAHAAAPARRAALRPDPARGRPVAARGQPLLRAPGAAARRGGGPRRRHGPALRPQHAHRLPVSLPRDVPGLRPHEGPGAGLEGRRGRLLPVGGDRGRGSLRGRGAAARHARARPSWRPWPERLSPTSPCSRPSTCSRNPWSASCPSA